MKKVYGSYLSAEEARQAVDELLGQGYARNEVKVISNKDLGGKFQDDKDHGDNHERSLWEKIKDAFTFHEYDDDEWDRNLDDDEKSALESYETNLKAGEVIVLVEEGADGFRDYFRDGAPDWDEREEEFNEEFDNGGVEFSKPPSKGFMPPINRDNLKEDERINEIKKESNINKGKEIFNKENMLNEEKALIPDPSKEDSGEKHLNMSDPEKALISDPSKEAIGEKHKPKKEIKIDTSRVDESSIENKETDSLISDDSDGSRLVTDEIIDLNEDDI